MILTLEVTGPQAARLGAAARKVFTEAGGTIGRLRSNDWVLTDPWVSSRHAIIRFIGGAFHIEDTSTNGVFINSPDNRLVPGQPYPITSGDEILIDPYQIRAVVSGESAVEADPFSSPRPADPWPATPPPPPRAPDPWPAPPPASRASDPWPSPSRSSDPWPAPAPSSPSILPPDMGGLSPEDDNWLDQLGGPPSPAPAPAPPRASDLGRGSGLADHYRPPAAVPPAPPPAPASAPPASIIPDDWLSDLGDSDPAATPAVPALPEIEPPAPAAAGERTLPDAAPSPGFEEPLPGGARPPEPARAVRQPAEPVPGGSGGGAALAAVLEGAGLEGVAVTPELAASFGQILRVVVSGVMDILQARQRIKSEFRMEVTSFKPAQNNPLKFSANVDDALHNLLVKRNAAYLGPVEAFEDAFEDLRNHQMAMLAGVRVAFDAMLAAFDPATLQQQFDRDLKKGALLNIPGKLRYWDQYCERIRGMVQDPDTTFRQLFGEEFATAYEEQLARLKAEGRARKR